MSTVITGNTLTLTIGATAYTAQVTAVIVNREDTQETFDALGSRVYKTVTFPYTMDVTILPDWGATGSLCSALTTSALTAPDTSLAFVLKVEEGTTEETVVEGSVFPELVETGGAGFEVTPVTISFTGDRNVPLEFNPTP
jgi:hypothetical protein